jgi:hypothetical protein
VPPLPPLVLPEAPDEPIVPPLAPEPLPPVVAGVGFESGVALHAENARVTPAASQLIHCFMPV